MERKKKLPRRVVNKLTGEISTVIPKPSSSSSSMHVPSHDDPVPMPIPVNQSLSSAFFRNLQKEKEKEGAEKEKGVIFNLLLLIIIHNPSSICDESIVHHSSLKSQSYLVATAVSYHCVLLPIYYK